jgi:hypothetical protein
MNNNCKDDMSRTYKDRTYTIRDMLLAAVQQAIVTFAWNSDVVNAPVNKLIGGTATDQTIYDWFNVDHNLAGPRVAGVTRGIQIIITDLGATDQRRLSLTMVHELFHVAGYEEHLDIANALGFLPGINGMPLASVVRHTD